MPNHVTNRITVELPDAASQERIDEVLAIFEKIAPGGKIDFETLIPTPAYVYQGDCSSEDEKDFTTWYE